MKTIIKNRKNGSILKNNRLHYLYYHNMYAVQEDFTYNKRGAYHFQDKYHNYYKKCYMWYYFNNKCFYL
jgi:hypothetical protein